MGIKARKQEDIDNQAKRIMVSAIDSGADGCLMSTKVSKELEKEMIDKGYMLTGYEFDSVNYYVVRW